MAEQTDSMSFEQALQALEEIVAQLERGEVSLDDAVAAYERGAKLKAFCQQRLDEARLKVEQIRAQRGESTAEGTTAFSIDEN